MRTLISVIIPTFNGERTLMRAIASVESQLAPGVDYEILICDDGSTDTTLDIARLKDCTILHNDHHTGGPNEGRNRGILFARGQYIAFLDQDDEWVSNKTYTQLMRMHEGFDCSYSAAMVNGRIPKWGREGSIHQALLDFDKRMNWPYMSSILVRNDGRVPMFETTHGSLDVDWCLKLTATHRCIEVPPVVHRHVTPDRLSQDMGYRMGDYLRSMELLSDIGRRRKNASLARYHYTRGNYSACRHYLKAGPLTVKNVAYWITSWISPLARMITKRWRVF